VQWSPVFCFRSRFFGVYVLGRSLAHGWDPADPSSLDIPTAQRGQVQKMIMDGQPAPAQTDPLYPIYMQQYKFMNDISGERRLEAVYDAFADKILWQRESITEKRSMGDPP
jgi:hypothetical protein